MNNDNDCATGKECIKGICDIPPPSCNKERSPGCREDSPCVRALNC